MSSDKFYVQIVVGGTEIELSRPFPSDGDRDVEARSIYNGDDYNQGEDSIFWLNVFADGKVVCGSYTDADLMKPEEIVRRDRIDKLYAAVKFAKDINVPLTMTLKELHKRVEGLPFDKQFPDTVRYDLGGGSSGNVHVGSALESIEDAIEFFGDTTVEEFLLKIKSVE